MLTVQLSHKYTIYFILCRFLLLKQRNCVYKYHSLPSLENVSSHLTYTNYANVHFECYDSYMYF